MANNSRQNANERKEMIMVGAGLAALAAGAYFFFGPEGKKHQKKMKGWMVRMKGEVLEKIEETQEVTQPIYEEIVDTVARTYEVAGKIPREEIAVLASDMKKQWRTITNALKNKGGSKVPAKKKAASKGGAKKKAAKKGGRKSR